MLKNDKVNLVIALLIAIALWVYVMVEVNPSKDTPMRGIPITFLNEAALEEENLTLLSVSDVTVDIVAKGKVSDLKGVTKEDIKIYADLEGYKAGEHTVRLQIGRVDNVEIECKQKINVVIDHLISAEKNITVSLAGNMNDEQEPYVVQASPQRVLVTGAKTLVDSVVRVDAALNVEKVGNELKAFSVPLSPVDSSGTVVENVILNVNSASVSAVNLNKKTVRLEVPVTGTSSNDADRTVTVPKTITVKGMDVDLKSLTAISAEPLDVSDVYEDTTIEITPVLPNGVKVAANSEDLKAQVTVKGMGSRTFEYSKDAVVAEGVAENMTIEVENVTIKLHATGKESVTERLNADDFSFIIDAETLKEGSQLAELQCRYDGVLSLVEFSPKMVSVTLTVKEEEGSQTGNDSEMGEQDSSSEDGSEAGTDSEILPDDSNGTEDDEETKFPDYPVSNETTEGTGVPADSDIAAEETEEP